MAWYTDILVDHPHGTSLHRTSFSPILRENTKSCETPYLHPTLPLPWPFYPSCNSPRLLETPKTTFFCLCPATPEFESRPRFQSKNLPLIFCFQTFETAQKIRKMPDGEALKCQGGAGAGAGASGQRKRREREGSQGAGEGKDSSGKRVITAVGESQEGREGVAFNGSKEAELPGVPPLPLNVAVAA